MAVTRRGLTPATVEHGRVIDIDIATYTLTVVGEFARNPVSNVTFMTPYQHYSNGEGVYFMPEVGSLIWICFPSDGNKPFVLGWAPAGLEGDYRSRKMDLNPGDIYLGTRDENFIILRRGGVVQIGGGGICQRLYMPISNLIADFCQNYKLQSMGGSLEWTIGLKENSSDGHTPATLDLKAKLFSDDPAEVAELKIGSHDGDADTILSLITNSDGTTSATQQVSLKIDKNGNVKWVVQGDVSWDVTGSYSVTAKESIDLTSTDASISISAKTPVSIESKSSSISLQSALTIDISAGTQVNIGPMAYVGKGVVLPVALGPPLLAWLAAHTHLLTLPVPGSPTSPPVPPPPAFFATKLFAI